MLRDVDELVGIHTVSRRRRSMAGARSTKPLPALFTDQRGGAKRIIQMGLGKNTVAPIPRRSQAVKGS
jgi:hypothetical protein